MIRIVCAISRPQWQMPLHHSSEDGCSHLYKLCALSALQQRRSWHTRASHCSYSNTYLRRAINILNRWLFYVMAGYCCINKHICNGKMQQADDDNNYCFNGNQMTRNTNTSRLIYSVLKYRSNNTRFPNILDASLALKHGKRKLCPNDWEKVLQFFTVCSKT